MMRVDLLKPDDSRVHAFIDGMMSLYPLQPPAVIFFGDDRMYRVNAVALLNVNGIDTGIATLSENGEEDEGIPAIVGLWIDPEFKSHPQYLEYGIALFKVLADESMRRCNQAPRFYPVTHTEQDIVEEAQKQGIVFVHIPVLRREQMQDW